MKNSKGKINLFYELDNDLQTLIYSYDNTYYNKYRCLICEYYTNLCNYKHYIWISYLRLGVESLLNNETIEYIKEFEESRIYKHRFLYKIIDENLNSVELYDSDDSDDE